MGESWEISDVPGDESVVAEGADAGKNLTQLMEEYKGKLVGEENYKRFQGKFPLLIKFIDAKQDLSIQVHPDDELAPKDNVTNYYFDRFSKGTHVIETEYYVDREGTYETGTCTVQCAYSPEYSGRAVSKVIVIE